MLNACARENSHYGYLDLAPIMQENSSKVKADLSELWHRILFSGLIFNTDDHLHNHGFLRFDRRGWELSPLYDVNPCSERTDYLLLKINDQENRAEVDLVLEVSDFLGIARHRAERDLKRMKKIISSWPSLTQERGIKKAEIGQIQIAFKRAEAKMAENTGFEPANGF